MMELLWEYKKAIGTISLQDFRRFPIWTMKETDFEGTFAVPIRITDPLVEDDDILVLFVLCKVRLRDLTPMEGIIYIDMVRRTEYGLEMFFEGEELFVAPQQHWKWSFEDSRDEFAQRLGKSLDQVTPVTYTTPYRLSDGTPISGQIDLLTW